MGRRSVNALIHRLLRNLYSIHDPLGPVRNNMIVKITSKR